MKQDGEHENAFPALEQLKASNNVPVKTRKVRRGKDHGQLHACLCLSNGIFVESSAGTFLRVIFLSFS